MSKNSSDDQAAVLAADSVAPKFSPNIQIRVQTQDFSLDELYDDVLAGVGDQCGAVAVFVGKVRDYSPTSKAANLDSVSVLELTHYEGMTQSVLQQIAEQVCSDHNLVGLHVIHRVGKLGLGERIVGLAAASGHRGDAFAGCRAMMERLKSDAPFWKKEWLEGGEAVWVDK